MTHPQIQPGRDLRPSWISVPLDMKSLLPVILYEKGPASGRSRTFSYPLTAGCAVGELGTPRASLDVTASLLSVQSERPNPIRPTPKGTAANLPTSWGTTEARGATTAPAITRIAAQDHRILARRTAMPNRRPPARYSTPATVLIDSRAPSVPSVPSPLNSPLKFSTNHVIDDQGSSPRRTRK